MHKTKRWGMEYIVVRTKISHHHVYIVCNLTHFCQEYSSDCLSVFVMASMVSYIVIWLLIVHIYPNYDIKCEFRFCYLKPLKMCFLHGSWKTACVAKILTKRLKWWRVILFYIVLNLYVSTNENSGWELDIFLQFTCQCLTLAIAYSH